MSKFIVLSLSLIIIGISITYPANEGRAAGYDPGIPLSGTPIAQDITTQLPSNQNHASDTAKPTGNAAIFKYYVTPRIDPVNDLLAQVNSPEEAYQLAVNWVYVSDSTLNAASDKWLSPREFLTGTPDFPASPVRGQAVSDCEEQANTLVSLLRALGIGPENVRAAAGIVSLNGEPTGHVWVELNFNEHWLALDPTCGPYWDDAAMKLVPRNGRPFDYYANRAYPVYEVWYYYNDISLNSPGDNL